MIPRLHVVTDDRVIGLEDFLVRAQEVLELGAHVALHVRGPGTTGRSLSDLAVALRGPAAASGAKLLVNDRADIALTLRLDGVHVGRRSLPVADVRALLGPDRLVGASVHGVDEARDADRAGADFLFVGSVWASPSHADRGGAGPGLIREVADAVAAPLLGIGGVTPERVDEILRAGGHGAAVISGIWYAPSSGDAARAYLQALSGPLRSLSE